MTRLKYSHITTLSGCESVNSHFTAVLLKICVPDTQRDANPSQLILTLGRPVLALPSISENQAEQLYLLDVTYCQFEGGGGALYFIHTVILVNGIALVQKDIQTLQSLYLLACKKWHHLRFIQKS